MCEHESFGTCGVPKRAGLFAGAEAKAATALDASAAGRIGNLDARARMEAMTIITKGLLFLLTSLTLAVLVLTLSTVAVARPVEGAPENVVPPVGNGATQAAIEEARQRLQERLSQRKAELQARLTAAEQRQVRNRCAAAQGQLRAAEARIQGVETRRMNAYGNLVDRLRGLTERLAEQGVDTVKLQSQIAELELKIANFQTRVADYRLAVADLGAMDCAADPEAFWATLHAARTNRAATAETALAIRDYVIGTIKLTLQDIKAQLVNMTEGRVDGQGQ